MQDNKSKAFLPEEMSGVEAWWQPSVLHGRGSAGQQTGRLTVIAKGSLTPRQCYL
jgi:hypothetical protein